jgi:DNA repair protein RecO
MESCALVIRLTPFGESHRMVLLATPEKGAVPAMARHGRKSLKRFPGALDYFKLIDVQCTKKSKHDELWQLESARIVYYYGDMVVRPLRYLAGCWAIESYRIIVPPEMEDPGVFQWLKDSMDYFETHDPDPASLVTSFIRLMVVSGNLPSFDRCVVCGREAPEGVSAFFDADSGGIVCRGCGGKKNLIPGDLRRLLTAAAGSGSLKTLESCPDELSRAARDNRRLLFQLMEELGHLQSPRKNFSAALLWKALETAGPIPSCCTERST